MTDDFGGAISCDNDAHLHLSGSKDNKRVVQKAISIGVDIYFLSEGI